MFYVPRLCKPATETLLDRMHVRSKVYNKQPYRLESVRLIDHFNYSKWLETYCVPLNRGVDPVDLSVTYKCLFQKFFCDIKKIGQLIAITNPFLVGLYDF